MLDVAAPERDNDGMADGTHLQRLSSAPDAVIEAYKKDVDRSLIRENLRLTPDARVRKMIAVLGFVEEVRRTNPASK